MFEMFRFVKHYRERKTARELELREERDAERQHQRMMLETIFTKIVESQKVHAESVMALAQAQQKSAEVLSDWLKGFHITDTTPRKPQVVRPEDEWRREQEARAAMGLPTDSFGVALPPEFALAYELAKQNNEILEAEGFDREA